VLSFIEMMNKHRRIGTWFMDDRGIISIRHSLCATDTKILNMMRANLLSATDLEALVGKCKALELVINLGMPAYKA
jgi:hypothetical protein